MVTFTFFGIELAEGVGAAAGGVAAATAKKKQDASHEVSVVGLGG